MSRIARRNSPFPSARTPHQKVRHLVQKTSSKARQGLISGILGDPIGEGGYATNYSLGILRSRFASTTLNLSRIASEVIHVWEDDSPRLGDKGTMVLFISIALSDPHTGHGRAILSGSSVVASRIKSMRHGRHVISPQTVHAAGETTRISSRQTLH